MPVSLNLVAPIVSKGAVAIKTAKTAIKAESKEIATSIKNKDIKGVLAVKNPVHGTIKYGALGFLIPIPGFQVVGMASGAIVGCAPVIKKAAQKIISMIN